MAVSVKALFFDVFGTLVDWRTSIAREAEAMLKPLGFTLDWAAGHGAAQTQIHAGAGIERQHLADGRSGAAQQFAVGRHPRFGDRRRLQAKTASLSRRRRGA